MADEIIITTRIQVKKDSAYIDMSVPPTANASSFKRTMTGNHWSQNIQDIGTIVEAVDVGADIAVPGYCRLKNVSTSTNQPSIVLFASDGTAQLSYSELEVGDVAQFPIGPNVDSLKPYAVSQNGVAQLECVVAEK